MSEPGIPSRARGRLGLAASVFFVITCGYTCFGPPGLAACGSGTGFGPAVLESVEHCPAAVERLGAPVRFGMLGLGCGNYESGGDSGDGYATADGVPIAGAKGSASADYALSKGGGVWQISKLVLTFGDGSRLDVGACTESFQRERGARGLENLLRTQCDEGQAAMCFSLAATLEGKGDVAGAKAAREKACQLGLSTACPK